MENLGVKNTRHCFKEYVEEESEAEAELEFYKSDLKTEIKSESISDAETVVKMLIKEEHPVDNNNPHQLNIENDLDAKMNEFVKNEEVIHFMKNEEIELKPIQTNKRKSNQIASGENKKMKIEEYCLKCQEFGHSTSIECITCFKCGVKGHPRRDCSADNKVFNKTIIDAKNDSATENNANIVIINGITDLERDNFSKNERSEIIRECTEDFVSPSDLGKKWNCNPETIRTWVRKAGKSLPKRYKKLKIQDSFNSSSQTAELQGKQDEKNMGNCVGSELNVDKPFTCPCSRFFGSLQGLEEHSRHIVRKEQDLGLKYPQVYELQKDVKRKFKKRHTFITAGLHKININSDESKTYPQQQQQKTYPQQQMNLEQQQKTQTQQQQKMYPQQKMNLQQQQNTHPLQQQNTYLQQQTYPQYQQQKTPPPPQQLQTYF